MLNLDIPARNSEQIVIECVSTHRVPIFYLALYASAVAEVKEALINAAMRPFAS
jgi:hypothetical protein